MFCYHWLFLQNGHALETPRPGSPQTQDFLSVPIVPVIEELLSDVSVGVVGLMIPKRLAFEVRQHRFPLVKAGSPSVQGSIEEDFGVQVRVEDLHRLFEDTMTVNRSFRGLLHGLGLAALLQSSETELLPQELVQSLFG